MATKAELEVQVAALKSANAQLETERELLETDKATYKASAERSEAVADQARKRINKVALKEPTYTDEKSAEGSRRPSAVYSVHLNSVDGFGPPAKILDMTLIGDCLFLAISAYAEDHDSKATTRLQEILERAGMECVWQSEINEHASLVLKKHWPDVPNLGDITQIDWTTVGRVDLICGGYPCQPFSNTGSRRGVNDERHLWPYFFNAIRVLRPRFVLAENVPGHLSLGFDRVLADLASIGYDAEWSLVSACSMGAPHTRERLYVVAYPEGHGWRGFGNPTPAQATRSARYVDREPEGSGTETYWSSIPAPEPFGMAHGVPTGLDRARLKEHGNAVVPQVSEWIGRRILEAIT